MVKVLRWKSGDWIALEVDGELVYEGHTIPDAVWVTLLSQGFRSIPPNVVVELQIEDDEDGPTDYADLGQTTN